jgi:hypothetical protein
VTHLTQILTRNTRLHIKSASAPSLPSIPISTPPTVARLPHRRPPPFVAPLSLTLPHLTRCHLFRVQIGRRVEAATHHSGSTWSATICCAATVCLPFNLPLFLIYITARFCRLMYRPECNQFSGDICVLYREPISDSCATCSGSDVCGGCGQRRGLRRSRRTLSTHAQAPIRSAAYI